jgi:hypothetical protein
MKSRPKCSWFAKAKVIEKTKISSFVADPVELEAVGRVREAVELDLINYLLD